MAYHRIIKRLGLLIALSAVAGFLLTSPDAGVAGSPIQSAPGTALALPPTTVTTDEDGYTLWTVDWSPWAWCVPYSRIRYPFDLGVYDPTAFSDASLNLTYNQGVYDPLGYSDPTWTVALNGKPPDEWRDVGTFSGPVINPEVWPTSARSSAVVPLNEETLKLLIDGENNVWLRQHDFCPTELLEDAACTCVDIRTVQLRARVNLGVRSVSPQPDTRNVWPDQRSDSEIRIKFTAPVSITTVNNETFQVYYFDENVVKVQVNGEIKRISDAEFAFVPAAELLPGVQYIAQVWGEEDALAHNHADWVQDTLGGSLKEGRLWTFWTLPDIQVTVKPVQVLEGMALIAHKPTVVRTFIRWDLQPGVFQHSQLPNVEVDDVRLIWMATEGVDSGTAAWSEGTQWEPARTPQSALRKREYREMTTAEESYTNREKWQVLDSVNYYGFTPPAAGSYQITVRVLVNDSRGRAHPFVGQVTVNATTVRDFQVDMRAIAVGADYGKTGVVDLSAPIDASLNRLRAIYPIAGLRGPAAPSAMQCYTPTTTLWFFDWHTEPGNSFLKKYMLQELSALCQRTTNCRAMIGLTRPAWLVDGGLTLPEAAPWGALIKNDSIGASTFVAAHEVGHLARFEHSEEPAGEGFDVRRRTDKRYSVDHDVFDFMTIDPVEALGNQLWIANWHYVSLALWTGATPVQATNAPLAVSSDPLLLVSGVMTESTGATTLLPWYQMTPGEWQPPETGPYSLVFLDDADQELDAYTRAFTVSATLQPAGAAPLTDDPAFFTFVTPYPAAAAKAQIRRTADNIVLAEVIPGASAPTVSIDPPGSNTWTGAQPLTWQADAGAHYFAVDVSTDGGTSWEALAINLTGESYTLQTVALPNTTQALVRVAATDGFRTGIATAGPFTITNPPLVGYVSPIPDATGVGIRESVYAGFRDSMDAATLTNSTFTLLGGPFGNVPGAVTYDTATQEATFAPVVPLVYATQYTATLTTGIQDMNGEHLPIAHTWTFTTEMDVAPPSPVTLSPKDGALNVPRDVVLAVAWDRALNASTLNTNTFVLATASGTLISGTVAYDAAARAATFTPAAALITDTLYIATLKAGIASADGYTTTDDFNWAFTAGTVSSATLRFTGAYGDEGLDSNGDGLYEQLVIRVGVQTPVSGTLTLQGILADTAGAEIGWTESAADLQSGAHFIDLYFDGAQIGGRGVDGPYTLTRLTLSAPDGQVVWAMDAYRTFAYAASQFPAPLHFGGLPDLLLRPGASLDSAFNVYAYAQHATQNSASLTYIVLANTDSRVGVTLDAEGDIHVNPEPGWGGEVWTGSTLVTLQAAYGPDRVQDTFRVTVGWFAKVYLPVTLRNFSPSSAQLTRSYWQIAFTDDFEQETLLWRRWSSYSAYPVRYYQWGRRDCGAYSGQYSMWPFGDGDDGALLSCGADYPAGLLESTMLRGPFNLQYTTQAEFRVKVWTNLAPGDEVCVMVTNQDLGEANMWQAQYYGVCRTGQTAGWEDLVLDLANVPTLGNLLGQEKVWVAVRFRSPQDTTGTRPVGAYVDDAMLRLCPLGLSCETTTSADWPSVSDVPATLAGVPAAAAGVPAAPAGVIGNYDAEIGEVTLAREANGRVHALWTGRLNPHFAQFVFYATAADGVNWTPFQILSYAAGSDPQIAVDDARQQVHLMYAADGIIHHVVENGVVSPPLVVDNTLESRFGLTTGPTRLQLTVVPGTGHVHAVWRQAHFTYINPTTLAGRFRTWYAYWNGAGWSARQQVINDDDTWDSTLAADTDGGVMLAWFQRWGQSQGSAIDPGEPTIPRTAYGLDATPGRFPLRQAVSAPYTVPEKDASILLTYSLGDGKYYLASEHLMWPTYSRVYRYVWADDVWSGPLDIAENTSGWSIPVYVGAAADTPLIHYVYYDNDVLKMRTETDGVLSAPQTVADYLSARSYTNTGSPVAYFTDAAGGLHMVVFGEKDGVAGFYYVKP